MTETYHFAVLGDPVEHSRSPAIHRGALKLAGLEGDYLAIRADERRLIATVEEMREGLFHGLNITMPLKEVAADIAGAHGAINTLRCRDNVVEGVSTDAVAFRELLVHESVRELPNILILGSGGSALSALAAIEKKRVYISGRNEKRVSEIADSPEEVTVVPWEAGVAGAVVLNCTPIGMDSEVLPELVISTAGALIDLPYGPPRTPAVATALEAGIPVFDGYEFLARQAAASFEWWTGIPVDFEPLAEIARNV